ncbi:Cu(I)-responsive transcriptional regulator [Acuticoccus kandeliae]|uniref:Cu(I)-responsive transcriptional regulator n=1 Tax=Acuticoccus kandeliae TaxID=2073160 RepID=UPI000D3E08C0|nr:Cu(I)-responsive transcriptional regulator [Acuticoccus kandeliae]
MNIGHAAAASGVSAKMIRYYEEIGLIAKPDRSASGYRRYSPADINTLTFIRRARSLGFSMEEISALLALWRDRSRASADVKALAMRHVDDLNTRIAELKAMADTLEHLAHNCHGDDRPDCPILETLATSDPLQPA